MNVYVFITVAIFTKRGPRKCCVDTCSSPCSRGDQILEVDSISLRHAALSEAYAILSECGPGPVSLIISRHPNPKVRGCLFIQTESFSFNMGVTYILYCVESP